MSRLTFFLASSLSLSTIASTITPAVAVEIQFSSPGNISQINGLIVEGITYNVTFESDTFINIFGLPNSPSFNPPTFWDKPQKAELAVESIASLLNTQQPIPPQINSNSFALVPYRGVVASDNSLFLVSKIDNFITRWDTFRGESEDIFTLGNEAATYALFAAQRQQAIPEANVMLGIIGFASVLGIRTLKQRFL